MHIRHREPVQRDMVMLDTILVATAIGFFVIAVLYVLACDRM
jgi:hypothetical protein